MDSLFPTLFKFWVEITFFINLSVLGKFQVQYSIQDKQKDFIPLWHPEALSPV
ncbi:MAG: hypothetical protein CM15mP4_2900 [Candidatus Neomarinimicrobiota bacterium]|nr:MAG: hypothetical protein CM15mP4_2900 [Candidatus Neomarinimicrobiota bacterium]